MASSVFDPTNRFWRGLSRLTDLVGLSLCFLVCSLPIVTAGAAGTALYDAVYHGVRLEGEPVYRRFFRTFRSNFKVATLSTLLALAVAALYAFLRQTTVMMAAGGSDLAVTLFHTYQILFAIPLAVWLFSLAILSRFTFELGGLLSTAVKLVFAHLPSAAVVTMLVLECADLVLRYWFPILFLPGLAALLASLFLERIFAPFLPHEEDS